MCVSDVLYVGEIEEIRVVAELEPGFASGVYIHYGRDELHVARTEDTSWAQGDREEFGSGEAVCGED